ncbi:hypothetical protein BKI52_12130 [marine bacterium AO1-C]|nr:hypothetical protein BKI52_12130 [marine bacterium AO1-C]
MMQFKNFYLYVPIVLGFVLFSSCNPKEDEVNATTECTTDDSTDQNAGSCDLSAYTSDYKEVVANGVRTITGSGLPDHTHGSQFDDNPNDPNGNVTITATNFTFAFSTSPSLANNSTDLATSNSYFGVAVNSVTIDPPPGPPFFFQNTETGEYNLDWAFEPTNNLDAVGIDCGGAHVRDGNGSYHYHADLLALAEKLSPGITTGTAPSAPILIGWAADGFPILYRYAPMANGNGVELLTSSWSLKEGERTGDGVSEPCGTYNGKYTNDYQYVSGSGNLDECNGISRTLTIQTPSGSTETFSYFYVMTEAFPVIPRCWSGTPDSDFSK